MGSLQAAPLAGLTLLACLACGPNIAEGTTRQMTQEGRSGLVAVKGMETFSDGEWRKEGEFVFYDDAGEEIGRGHYKRGLEEGPWRQKYDDDCTGVGSFKDGSPNGPWKTFHPNGKLQDSGSYDRGLREGIWLSYRDDGTKLREAQYVSGALNGQVTWYAKDGVTVDKNRTGIYADGQLNVR